MASLVSKTLRACLLFLTCAILLSRPAKAEDSPAPVRFGATLTLTGNAAFFGQSCLNGITLAVEDVNTSGGIQKAALQVLTEDFGNMDLKRAVLAAHQFIDLKGVVALLPNWSEDAEVLAPIAVSKKIISMTLGAGGPGASRFSKVSFRATSSDGDLAKRAAKDAIASGAKNACMLEADSRYFLDMQKEFVPEWNALGGKIVSLQTIPYLTTEIRGFVTNLRKVSCDVVIVWTVDSLPAIITELKNQHIEGIRILPWWVNTPDGLAATKDDPHEFSFYQYHLQDKPFLDRYRLRFHQEAQRPAGNCYDGVRLLATVMNEVGTSQEKVAARLLTLTNYTGVTGHFVIGADRERTGEYIEKTEIKNGKIYAAN